jgi:hypothetical protein
MCDGGGDGSLLQLDPSCVRWFSHVIIAVLKLVAVVTRGWKPSDQLEANAYIVLLGFADRFDIRMARKFAIHHLNTFNPPLSPIRKLELAKRFAVPQRFNPDEDIPLEEEPQWITESVETLLIDFTLDEYGLEDAKSLGFPIYRSLSRAYLKLELIRRTMAFQPPSVESLEPGAGCSFTKGHQKNCIDVWSEKWHKHISKAIIHPVCPLPFRNFANQVASRSVFNPIFPTCRERFYTLLEADSLPAGVRNVVDETIEEISMICYRN